MDITWSQKDAWVGVFDVLGFKDLSYQTDQEFPRRLLNSRLEDLFKELEDPDITEYGGLKYMIFADTIVVFTPSLSLQWYGWFLSQCQHLMHTSITIMLPLRGAISAGTVYISDYPPIIIGPPSVEAHNYCEDQDWVGLLMTPSATKKIRALGLEPLHHDFVSDTNSIPLRCMSADNVLAYRLHSGVSRQKSELLPPPYGNATIGAKQVCQREI